MADNDPRNQPDDFASNLGDRIKRDVHDQMNARMDERRARWEAKMERRRQRWSGRGMGGVGLHGASGGLFIGLILAGIGAVLLLQNLGFIPDQDLWDFWPVILIVAGVSRAASAYGATGRMWGGVIAVAGIVVLLANLGFIHHNIWTFFWPVVLIAAGALLLVRGLERNHHLDQWWGGSRPSGIGANAGPAPGPSIHRVHEFAIFGGGHRRIDSKEFEGGDIVALFGGVQLDLRMAETKLEEMVVDVTAAFGGAEIRVPETWAVSMRVTSIFGGYDDKTHVPPPGATKPPLLVVTGAVIFGGLAVKN
jgi:predicted membrane protein